MKWFIDHQYDSVIIMTMLGFLGGVVKVCGDPRHHSIKQNIASLLISGFSGMLTAMLFSKVFADPMYLGGICAMAGYMGQIILYRLGTVVQNALGIAKDIREGE